MSGAHAQGTANTCKSRTPEGMTPKHDTFPPCFPTPHETQGIHDKFADQKWEGQED